MQYTDSDTLDRLVAMIDDLSGMEIESRKDYSGRFMYGKECIGFVVDNPTYFLMALTAALIDFENNGDYVPDWRDLDSRQDSMGLSTIVYFPNWQIDDSDLGDDETDV